MLSPLNSTLLIEETQEELWNLDDLIDDEYEKCSMEAIMKNEREAETYYE